jgi:hypothetical protein
VQGFGPRRVPSYFWRWLHIGPLLRGTLDKHDTSPGTDIDADQVRDRLAGARVVAERAGLVRRIDAPVAP